MARSTVSSSERLARAGSGVTRVYLDYAGFSPVDPRVVALMRPFLEGGVGNPSAPHSLGLEARASLDGARAKVARLVGATPAGVVFTASATEANNLAIRGLAERASGRHVVTSAVEHISVLNACRHLAKHGWEIAYVPVDAEGRIDPEAVARALRDDTALVSVMAANGEIGTVQPLREIGRAVRARGVPFHVDAVGAAGRVPVAVDDLGIDLLTLSARAAPRGCRTTPASSCPASRPTACCSSSTCAVSPRRRARRATWRAASRRTCSARSAARATRWRARSASRSAAGRRPRRSTPSSKRCPP